MMHHHKNWFPAVLILLSIALAIVVFFHVSPSSELPERVERGEVEMVDEGAYRTELKDVLDQYDERYQNAGTDLERLVATENALNALLALRVPETYRDLHLDLALGFNMITRGLRGEEGFDEGKAKLENARALNPWLE